MQEIQNYLQDKEELKSIVRLTKETDSRFLEKRNIVKEYNPLEAYNFHTWQDKLDREVMGNYEDLHKTLLYTDEKQSWTRALEVLGDIDMIFKSINE